MKIPMQINHVLETSLYADDLERAEVFYGTVLGLEVFAREAGRHAFFKCGRQMLLIFNPARTMEKCDAAPHGAHGPGHVAFSVPVAELDNWKSYLAKKGVAVEKDFTWPNGVRSVYFRDPAGNSLELTSPRLWNLPETAPSQP
jgi:catechol 2,3-dioxygenase-like lactoylglutathione lyase family enzyme